LKASGYDRTHSDAVGRGESAFAPGEDQKDSEESREADAQLSHEGEKIRGVIQYAMPLTGEMMEAGPGSIPVLSSCSNFCFWPILLKN
jgi:hypothetical protein